MVGILLKRLPNSPTSRHSHLWIFPSSRVSDSDLLLWREPDKRDKWHSHDEVIRWSFILLVLSSFCWNSLLPSHLLVLMDQVNVLGKAVWRGPHGKKPRAKRSQKLTRNWKLPTATRVRLEAPSPSKAWGRHHSAQYIGRILVREPAVWGLANSWLASCPT